MEFEFDKEMDSLLRQAAKGDSLFPKQSLPSEHIDADEISIFAENALPEKAKPRVMKHLADCDRCRTILSNVIALNSEAVVAPVTNKQVETVVASREPSWFQKLFSTRNLAFGMGTLALIFAVGIGFIFVQNSINPQSEMAKASDNNASSADQAAPNELTDPTLEENSITNSNSALNLGDGSNAELDGIDSKDSDSEIAPAQGGRELTSESAKNKQNKAIPEDAKESLKGSKEAKDDSLQSPPPPPVVSDIMTDAGDSRITEENEKDEAPISGSRDDKPATNRRARKAPKPAKPITTRRGVEKSKIKVGDAESRQEAKTPRANKKKTVPNRRRVGDKTFTRKNSTWTDSKYKGQRTTTVIRDTADYRKLDSGLQSIGNQLNGTVVVVWKSKAYKIQ